jgi:hypothetical protein
MLFAKNNPTKVLESFFFFSRTPIMNKPYGATCWCMGVWFPKGLYFFCNMLTHGDSTCNFVDAWGFNFQTINFACGGKKSKVHLGFLFSGLLLMCGANNSQASWSLWYVDVWKHQLILKVFYFLAVMSMSKVFNFLMVMLISKVFCSMWLC